MLQSYAARSMLRQRISPSALASFSARRPYATEASEGPDKRMQAAEALKGHFVEDLRASGPDLNPLACHRC